MSAGLVSKSTVKAKYDRHGNKRSMVARGLRARPRGEAYSDVLRAHFRKNALTRLRGEL